MSSTLTRGKLGVAVVGVGGAVATTAVAGIEMIRRGANSFDGLPLGGHDVPGLTDYRDLVFAGWDMNPDHLAHAARNHEVLDTAQIADVDEALSAIKPWPAVVNSDFCKNITGSNVKPVAGHRAAIAAIAADLTRFRDSGVENVVMINLASTEAGHPDTAPLESAAAFERALDENHPAIGPGMLYAYAAIQENVAYGNFTPSHGADVPALVELATKRNVPVAGRDGKTGQTMMKTVIAPALRSRALHVDGCFSTNILGNRDGLALDNPDSLASKLATKKSVLDSILGYKVEDHIIDIRYYRPRGDDKDAWDNIDVSGFLGRKMQIKINFLCKDSILAAPLVIEIARVLDLAQKRGEGGVQEQLGVFFKAPMSAAGRPADHEPEHALDRQQQHLLEWLSDRPE
jgi:myo-inositol-1-phosphate synthase